ncbi:hypothetical protein, partial [Photobacterium halotolerans]|uniref:hypothetical protein n=1 Tax=Photobacterium halotolerans TaxID=265726 RepID=UPI001F22C9B2
APCQKNHQTQARHTSAVPKSTSHNTPKSKKKSTPAGKNSGRIFRLSAPGAPTTDPDHTKEQQGLSGHSLA